MNEHTTDPAEPTAPSSGGSRDPWTQNSQVTGESGSGGSVGWERELISKLAQDALVEKRRARRWGIFFKFLFFSYILVAGFIFYDAVYQSDDPFSKEHVAVVSVSGVIAAGTDADAGRINAGLRAAFKNEDTQGVIVKINSPGGSPVQAGLIYDEIIRLREKHQEIPLYAVVTDVCASGGYYIAAAAQSIYADKASVVGSIGVRADSFGFVEAMKKLGVERRLHTAGNNKAMLDPFAPQRPQDVQHLTRLLSAIHQQFIDAVKTGRGDRLADDPDLYSGLVWTGEEGVALGLVDGLGSLRYVANELIGSDTLVDYTPRKRWLDQILEVTGGTIKPALDQWFRGSVVLY